MLRAADGVVTLAPLYDVSTHALSPNGNLNMSLKVNGRVYQPSLTVEALVAEGVSWVWRISTHGPLSPAPWSGWSWPWRVKTPPMSVTRCTASLPTAPATCWKSRVPASARPPHV